MSQLECPSCDKLFNYEGDYEDFYQDSEHEFECPHCGIEFLAIVYWDIVFTGERLKPKDEVEVDDE